MPLECEFFALRGVALLTETIEKVQERLNPDLELDGILATMYDSRTVHSREVLARVVEAFDDHVYHTVIGRTVRFPETTVAGEPITRTPPTPSVPPPTASSPGRCSPGVTPSESAGGRRTLPYDRGMALQASTPRRPANGEARVPAPAGESDQAAAEDAPQSVPAQGGDGEGAEHAAADAEQGAAGESRSRGAERSARGAGTGAATQEGSAAQGQPRKRGRAAARRPSGRERHDEKITVYVSAEELMDSSTPAWCSGASTDWPSTAAASSARPSPWSSPTWRPAGTPASSYDGCAGGSGSLRGP